MHAFLRQYVNSLTNSALRHENLDSPERSRDGYSFTERYWASLTRTRLPPQPLSKSEIDINFGANGNLGNTRTLNRAGEEAKADDFNGPYKPPPERNRPMDSRRSHRYPGPRTRFIVATSACLTLSAGVATGAYLSSRTQRPSDALSSPIAASQADGAPSFSAPSGNDETSPDKKDATAPSGHSAQVEPTGTIFYPGAEDKFFTGESIPAFGATEPLQRSHQLMLIISYSVSGKSYAQASDVTIADENWQGTIPAPRAGLARLLLVDLGPEAVQIIQQEGGLSSNVSSVLVSPGVTVLDETELHILSGNK